MGVEAAEAAVVGVAAGVVATDLQPRIETTRRAAPTIASPHIPAGEPRCAASPAGQTSRSQAHRAS